MKLARLALFAIVSLVLAACSSAGATSAPSVVASAPPSSGATAPASPSGAASPAASASTRIEVALTDNMAIELDMMTVPTGVPVTFIVSNTGAADHEFYLGEESAQLAHEDEMMSNGGMLHDEPEGISVAPGQTREMTYTFTKAGMTLAGCHVAGHYAAGMMAQITVTD